MPSAQARSGPLLSMTELRLAGRTPPSMFRVGLADGGELALSRVLRVLPGKRIVGEVLWQGRVVLAKLFIAEGGERHAATEADGVRRLRQAGVPTPELLSVQALRGGGHAVLSEFLVGARRLADDWAGISLEQDAVRCLQPIFAVMRQLHQAGLVHDDLHLGNFLRQGEQCYLIDGDAVRQVAGAKAQQREAQRANLALFCAQLPVWCDACLPALLEEYAVNWADAPDVTALNVAIGDARVLRVKKFLAKTGRDCTEFVAVRRFHRFSAMRRSEASWLREALSAADRLVSEGAMLKDGGTCTVVRADLGGRVCVIKRYNLKNWRHAMSRLWRPSRAWHSWQAGHMLQHLGIDTPSPLGVLEERIGPMRRRAFLVTEHCRGVSLLEHLSARCAPGEAEGEALLRVFRAMHAMRIEHGDLKATNLLWCEGRVYLIDLDALRMHSSATTYLRAWKRDRARLLANWPATSALHRWLDKHLPPS